jgi:hypothetical protein
MSITKTAEEISAKFRHYQVWVETQGFHTKRVRSDNGSGECSHSVKFWPEAIRTACYLHRRSPTSSLSGNRSPYEALYGTIPKIGHLRQFGCRVYKHISPAQRSETKFGNRSSVCMMLRYVHNTTKIWRIWEFNSGRTGLAVECSSVMFQEENAHTEEQITAIGFPDNADEFHTEDHLSRSDSPSRQENSPSRQDSPSRHENGPLRQENSKSKTLNPVIQRVGSTSCWAELRVTSELAL